MHDAVTYREQSCRESLLLLLCC